MISRIIQKTGGNFPMIRPEVIKNEFLKLASVTSPTFGERPMADLLRPRLEQLGFTVKEDRAIADLGGNCGNLYGFRPGELAGEPLLFSAHMDTVKPCENKHVLLDDDGTIHTDGTTILGADDLSGVVEFLQAVGSCIEDGIPLRPLEVLFSVSEEFFLKGAAGFDFRQVRAKQAYVLDVDGLIGTAVLGAPTGYRFVAHVHGRAAHAALSPENGINAIGIAARAVANIPQGRLDDETTANIGIIRGGVAGNVVSDECFVEGETRSLCHEKAEAQCRLMQAAFEQAARDLGGFVTFEITKVYDAYATPADHPVVQRFVTACEAVGLAPQLVTSCGGSDNSVFAQNGITGIVVASGMHNIHGVDEYTTVDELVKMTELVTQLLQLP
jgi:tripeptide aminopeptidase